MTGAAAKVHVGDAGDRATDRIPLDRRRGALPAHLGRTASPARLNAGSTR